MSEGVTDEQQISNIYKFMSSNSVEQINALLIEFADYLASDIHNVQVLYADGIRRSSMMMSSKYLKYEPEQYINALKSDYLLTFDEDGKSNTRTCLMYAMRLLPRDVADVLTMEQDSVYRDEMMTNYQRLKDEIEVLDIYKQKTFQKRTSSEDLETDNEKEHTIKQPSLLKRLFSYIFPNPT